MKALANVIGIIFIIGGIFVGAWVALYLCLYGGVVQIVEGCTLDPVSAKDIGLGVLRVCCTVLSFWLTFLFCGLVGSVCLALGEDNEEKVG